MLLRNFSANMISVRWRNVSPVLLSVALMMLLSGCGTILKPPQAPVIVSHSPEKPIYPLPDPVNLLSVSWKVCSSAPEHKSKCLEWLEQHRATFGLSPQAYEHLALNMQELLSYVKQLRALVERYQLEREEENARIRKRAAQAE